MKGYYPNPIFERRNWLDLDGQWEFAFDDEDIGLSENWAIVSLPADHMGLVFWAALQDQVNGEAWGYNGAASSSKDLEDKLQVLMDAIYSVDRLWGFCYTQLTDVQQEFNVLLDENHNPKCNVEVLNEIFSKR